MTTTIILPHKHGPMNDECLKLSLEMLKANTSISYDLIVDDSPKDPYQIWNDVAKEVKTDVIVMTNTDVLMAPGWDVMVKHVQPNAIITGYLVECNAICVHGLNISRNYGQKPSTFNRQEFENFAREHGASLPEIKEERGWYMPCAMNREWFLSTRGFDLTFGGFPHPLDIYFWEECMKDPAFKLLRARSYAYHFQNLSNESRVERA